MIMGKYYRRVLGIKNLAYEINKNKKAHYTNTRDTTRKIEEYERSCVLTRM